jgi:uncharacterized membrane protein
MDATLHRSAVPSQLWARLTYSKTLFGLLCLNLFWSASLFIAPLILAPGTFAWPYTQYSSVAYHLGGANRLDYEPIWQSLWIYPRAVYTFGDIQCHQLWYRSFFINGNQMPMCERMVSMYLFANVGLVSAAFAKPASTASQVMLNAMPSWIRDPLSRIRQEQAAGLLLFLFLLPTAVDGFTQLLTSYESDPVKRVLTGSLAGFIGGLLVGAMFVSMRHFLEQLRLRQSRVRASYP